MTPLSKVRVHSRTRVFDDFFKVDEVRLSHLQLNGQMSEEKRSLVFERGDSVAVLLYNRDALQVILVNQFKAPTMKGPNRGWITEVAAGMIRPGETSEAAAVRETFEETGYRIAHPRHIATFFSSPGGSSERIDLYFAEVGNDDREGKGGGNRAEGEDIEVVAVYTKDLFQQLESRGIDDPKLLIGAYWLQDYLRKPKPPLAFSTRKYCLKGDASLIVGYKTGQILDIKDVDVWVNSENVDMTMDRFIGSTISANIRYGGAEKDDNDNIIEDSIADALREKLGPRHYVRIGTVIETEACRLAIDNNVKRILHVATVKSAGPGRGVKADVADVSDCVKKVLAHAHKRNERLMRLFSRDRHILIPLLGTGDGGLAVQEVAPKLVAAAVDFLQRNPKTSLREIYFLAYSAPHQEACEIAFRRNGALQRAD